MTLHRVGVRAVLLTLGRVDGRERYVVRRTLGRARCGDDDAPEGARLDPVGFQLDPCPVADGGGEHDQRGQSDQRGVTLKRGGGFASDPCQRGG